MKFPKQSSINNGLHYFKNIWQNISKRLPKSLQKKIHLPYMIPLNPIQPIKGMYAFLITHIAKASTLRFSQRIYFQIQQKISRQIKKVWTDVDLMMIWSLVAAKWIAPIQDTTVANLAVTNATIYQWISVFKKWTVQQFSPKNIFISLGSADVARRALRVSNKDIQLAYTYLLDFVQNTFPRATILVANIRVTWNDSISKRTTITKLNEFIQKTCQQKGYAHIDLNAILEKSDYQFKSPRIKASWYQKLTVAVKKYMKL